MVQYVYNPEFESPCWQMVMCGPKMFSIFTRNTPVSEFNFTGTLVSSPPSLLLHFISHPINQFHSYIIHVSLILRERFRVFENRSPRQIFGSKRDENADEEGI